jgi:hypothetical protein
VDFSMSAEDLSEATGAVLLNLTSSAAVLAEALESPPGLATRFILRV